jgi:sulfur carrier protein
MSAEPNVEVQLNGERHEVPAGQSVAGMLQHLGLHPRMVVVEHNGVILRREALEATSIAPGDAFEVVHFVGGG